MSSDLKNKHKFKTNLGFGYNVIGILLPFILSLIGMAIIWDFKHVLTFIDDGRFLLFATGLLTSSIYMFQDDQNKKAILKSNYWYDKIIDHLSLGVLLITSVIYAIVYTILISHSSIVFQPNVTFVRIFSIVALLFSCYASYSAIKIDLLKIYPSVNVQEEDSLAVDKLKEEL